MGHNIRTVYFLDFRRLSSYKKSIDWLASRNDCKFINVIVDKRGKSEDVFELAWKALIQRFENTIRYRNLPGPMNQDDRGLILPDQTDNKKLQTILGSIRKLNSISDKKAGYGSGSGNITPDFIVEDPFLKNSEHSYFTQMVDTSAYFLKQLYEPNNYIRKKYAGNYFHRLSPVLCTQASRSNKYGIVEL